VTILQVSTNFPGTVLGRNWPEATAHGARRPATRGRPKRQLGHGLAAQPSGAPALCGVLQCAHQCGHRAWDGAVACSPAAWRWLNGGKVLPEISRGGHGEGAGQGGEGRRAPERRVDGETAQTASGGSVRRLGGGSGGWRRRVWGPAAPERQVG
jgi:hypothetical protein